jgi:hypothetical protein
MLTLISDNIIVMCNRDKNELYSLRAQGENKQKTDWLKKYGNQVCTVFSSHSRQMLG